MSEQRLIDASDVRQELWEWAEGIFASEPDNYKFNALIDIVDRTPTTEHPVVRGEWVKRYDDSSQDYNRDNNWEYVCSKCKRWSKDKSNFCPSCGAKNG